MYHTNSIKYESTADIHLSIITSNLSATCVFRVSRVSRVFRAIFLNANVWERLDHLVMNLRNGSAENPVVMSSDEETDNQA